MYSFKFAALLLAAATLAGCVGRDPSDHTTKVKFNSQVSFGDSWSDVGSYAVGQIAVDIRAGACVPADAQASNCQAAAIAKLSATVGAAAASTFVQTNASAVIAAMGVAGTELAGYVKAQIVGKGARYVVVINLPDAGLSLEAVAADKETQALITSMVTTFNAQLKSGVSGDASVLYLDMHTFTRDLIVNLGSYGLLNVSSPACDLSYAKNLLGFALICNRSNLAPGNVDNYLLADNSGHLTPFGYSLVSVYLAKEMAGRGWL